MRRRWRTRPARRQCRPTRAATPADALTPAAAAPPALLRSFTWKRKDLRSEPSAMALALHPDGPVAGSLDPEHDELERLRGRHADLAEELPGIHDAPRVQVVVAAHEEGLRLVRAGEGVGAPQLAEV